MNANFELEEWMHLIDWHIQMRPAMTARDVYKLLFQGLLGAEHIMPTIGVFTDQLREELATLQPERNEQLCELIRPDQGLSRINLRAFIAKCQDVYWLVEVCLRTVERRWGTQQDLIEVWNTFLNSTHSGTFPSIVEDDANSFNNWVEEYGYPAVHHSSIYEKTYLPAYRLVETEYLRGQKCLTYAKNY